MPDLFDTVANERTTDLITQTAGRYGVDPDLARRVARTESSLNPKARSPKGAIGVMQLMPSTADELGVDPNDLNQNIEGGVRYLGQLLDRYGGDKAKALAAYNAGTERVDEGGTLPAETQDYVRKILAGPAGTAKSGTAVKGKGDLFDQVAAESRFSQARVQAPGPAEPPVPRLREGESIEEYEQRADRIRRAQRTPGKKGVPTVAETEVGYQTHELTAPPIPFTPIGEGVSVGRAILQGARGLAGSAGATYLTHAALSKILPKNVTLALDVLAGVLGAKAAGGIPRASLAKYLSSLGKNESPTVGKLLESIEGTPAGRFPGDVRTPPERFPNEIRPPTGPTGGAPRPPTPPAETIPPPRQPPAYREFPEPVREPPPAVEPIQNVRASGRTFIKDPRPSAEDYTLVRVPTDKLDAGWAKEGPAFYIPKGGGGAQIGGRLQGAQQFIETGKPIQAPRVAMASNGRIVFEDGRHRFAALRDAGDKSTVVMVPKEQAAEFQALGKSPAAKAPEAPKSEQTYSFSHPKETFADLRKQIFVNSRKVRPGKTGDDTLRARFEELHGGRGISEADYDELLKFNEYLARNKGKLPTSEEYR